MSQEFNDQPENNHFKCNRCGEPVELGKNGMIFGRSLSDDGHPAEKILNSMKAFHYSQFCKNPFQKNESR